ncbi:ABC transporter substrate-binding protein [Pollutimonas nitritireducens]|uniref:ABC transporter substrate-binding protein n=1 Tax=Pollutimonas nitritireducens TaxID=2045209 RepID=A0A2N4UAH2_9BURK|nr:tripartite tricarboxylate transporter substrate binding protein [Pollutimonas nitritireducens]PLC52016.1 ABC transporter substrate-binding protein [Pollutimonas nitritireducens]
MLKTYRKARVLGGVFAVASMLALGAAAKAAYPERPITMVVNFGPGGVTDLMARALASGMEKNLKQTIVVQNKPGALGTLGPAHVAKQSPDGYTVAIVSASVVTTTPHLMDISIKPEDLIHVAGFGKNRYGIVVHADSEFKNVSDLVEAAKGSQSVFFGSPSTPNSLIFFDLGRKTGGKFELISYKAGPEASLALLSRQVAVIAANPPDVISHLNAGKLRLIASGSAERWREFPNVPTLREAGYDVSVEAWAGVAVPANTPPEVIDRLQESIEGALEMPEVQEKIRQVGADPMFMAGKEYTQYLLDEREKTGAIIKDAGIPRIK